MKQNNPGCNCCEPAIPNSWQASLRFKDTDPEEQNLDLRFVEGSTSEFLWGLVRQETSPFSVACDVQKTWQGVTPVAGKESAPDCDWSLVQIRSTPTQSSLTALPAAVAAGIPPLRFMNLTECFNTPTQPQWTFDVDFFSVPGNDPICAQLEGTVIPVQAGWAFGEIAPLDGSGEQSFFSLIPRSRNCVAPLSLPSQAVYSMSGITGNGTRCSEWNRAWAVDLLHEWSLTGLQFDSGFGYQGEFEVDGENRYLTVWMRWPLPVSGNLLVYSTYSDYRGQDPTQIQDQGYGYWEKFIPTVDGTNIDCEDLPNLLSVGPSDFQGQAFANSSEFDCDLSGATLSFSLT